MSQNTRKTCYGTIALDETILDILSSKSKEKHGCVTSSRSRCFIPKNGRIRRLTRLSSTKTATRKTFVLTNYVWAHRATMYPIGTRAERQS
ncbi:hypothetical protein ATCV1_z580L [Acanthocystis turfacea chlorella virus 1]|uniref:Uncharacterized protein z580L n=1 Tax=Chlorovirus heliozoae TaxID=322019 RepID=A7K9J0_9PHYC|nr:hypothetical protein ATCV1_z580L [Acanthocystis turfacea chlorella virus 1]ABT16714.1 hypothetical protein ATCV1_z580L [Acanthocystis turfacea chlorella virus 1]